MFGGWMERVWPVTPGRGAAEAESLPGAGCGPRLRHHRLVSKHGTNLDQDETRCVVYLPPGYDPVRAVAYPLLVLLHGWTDTEWSWARQGTLPHTADLLMASGLARSAVVAMPLGYGDGDFARAKFSVWRDLPRVRANTDAFCTVLEQELLPLLDREYNISHEPAQRTVAGLSMGGLQAAVYALRRPGEFGTAWVLSGAFDDENFDHLLCDTACGQSAPRVYVRCGRRDPLMASNRRFASWLQARGVQAVLTDTAGAHDWYTWSADLNAMLPQLF